MRFLLLIAVLGSLAVAQPIPPDITVDADGTGDFKTIEAAVQSIPKDNHQRLVILVKKGTYKEKVRLDAAGVTLRGEGRAATRIEFAQLNDDFVKNPDAPNSNADAKSLDLAGGSIQASQASALPRLAELTLPK